MQRAPPSIVRYTFLCLFLVATIHSALRAEKHQLTSQPRALRYRSFLIRFQLFHFFRVAICVGNCESHPNISVVHGVSACGLNQIPLISPTSRVFFLSASITCVLDCETAQTVHLFPYSRFASGIVNLPKHFICSWCPFASEIVELFRLLYLFILSQVISVAAGTSSLQKILCSCCLKNCDLCRGIVGVDSVVSFVAGDLCREL